jgi:hypothetical protein
MKQQLKQIYLLLSPYLSWIRAHLLSLIQKLKAYIGQTKASWWQIITSALVGLILLYYGLGGWAINNIDTSFSYKPKDEDGRLSSIDMISHLINREVYDKLWTANLPFLFPSYFLDNMPNFQQGIISATSKSVSAFNHIPLTTATETARANLNEATTLLKYPGNVWLFSPQNHLLPAPSSNTQYKKGRKKLNAFNAEIAGGQVVLERTPQNLSLLLTQIKKDIGRLIANTEDHVRENSDSFFDTKADDVFYFEQGKLYAYSQILKSLGHDFKNVLVKYDIYQQWTSMIKALEDASALSPLVVRNGNLDASTAPNHLMTINYFGSKAVNRLNNIINKLDRNG